MSPEKGTVGFDITDRHQTLMRMVRATPLSRDTGVRMFGTIAELFEANPDMELTVKDVVELTQAPPKAARAMLYMLHIGGALALEESRGPKPDRFRLYRKGEQIQIKPGLNFH